MNKHQIIGYVGKDPEIRKFPDGGMIANFSVATSFRYKNKNGERIEQTDWHNCVASGPLAEHVVSKYVQKGTHLYLSGRSINRKWQDKEGNDKYITEIKVDELELLSSNKSGGQTEQQERSPQQNTRKAAPTAHAPVEDDDIPF